MQGTRDAVFFFDIDNCLYEESIGVYRLMKDLIRQYALRAKIADDAVAVDSLCTRYYKDYGLAVRGLVLHHDIDPEDFDRNVDQALPLQDLLQPNPQLDAMLTKLKVRKWAFTNAGLVHAERVLGILGIRHHFEGITYCDYREQDIVCKPSIKAYLKAMKEAQVTDVTKCYFVDDSAANVETAATLGWTAVHVGGPAGDCARHHIGNILELPRVLPELWE